MRIQIKSTVNTGKFCEVNPMKQLFPIHLTAGAGGTHRAALRLITGRHRPGLRLNTGRRRTRLRLVARRRWPGLRLNARRRRTRFWLVARRRWPGLRLIARRHRPGLRLIARYGSPRLRLNARTLASSLVTGVSSLELSKRSVIHHLHAPRFPRNGLSSSGKIVPTCIALSN